MDTHRIIVADALSMMRNMSDNDADLIISCLPSYSDVERGIFPKDWESISEYFDWVRSCLFEFRRIMSDSGTLILCGGVYKSPLTFARVALMIEDCQLFRIQNWVTHRFSFGVGSTRNYISTRKDFLFLTKTDTYTFNVPYILQDVGNESKNKRNHPLRATNVWADLFVKNNYNNSAEAKEKEISSFFNRIITTHSNVDDFVFVPFIEYGDEVICAMNNNRRVFACDVSEEKVKNVRKRIEQMSMDFF